MLKLRELFITDQQRSVAKATGTIEDKRDLQAVRDDVSRKKVGIPV